MSTNNYIRIARSTLQRPRVDMFGNKLPYNAELIDRIAEQKLTAGYNTKRSNRCDTCFEFRSTNGTCSCLA